MFTLSLSPTEYKGLINYINFNIKEEEGYIRICNSRLAGGHYGLSLSDADFFRKNLSEHSTLLFNIKKGSFLQDGLMILSLSNESEYLKIKNLLKNTNFDLYDPEYLNEFPF